MDEKRLAALEERVADLEQDIQNQQQSFIDSTENLISDLKKMSKYFNYSMCGLRTAIQKLRREI